MTQEFKELTKEEALEELRDIYHRTRITFNFSVPYNIVAALLDKPQVMREAGGKMMYKESGF